MLLDRNSLTREEYEKQLNIKTEPNTIIQINSRDKKFVILTYYAKITTITPLILQEFLKLENTTSRILVCDSITANVYCNNIQTDKEGTPRNGIEMWRTEEVIVPLVDHVLQPKKIEKLGQFNLPQVRKVLETYMLQPSNMAQILVTDPVARYLGLVENDVIKFIRASPDAGLSFEYRVAVQDTKCNEMLF
jgi:DNA-directed RNA polymerase subunit H (RpoH/RPB5)